MSPGESMTLAAVSVVTVAAGAEAVWCLLAGHQLAATVGGVALLLGLVAGAVLWLV